MKTNGKKLGKKVLSLIVVLSMLISVVPASVLAEDAPSGAVAYVTAIDGGTAIDAEGEGGNDLGGGYYKTLQAAIDAAGTTPAKVQVVRKNVFIDEDNCYSSNSSNFTGLYIAENQTITFDLAGNNVTGYASYATSSSQLIDNRGTLTVMDSADTAADGSKGKLSYDAEHTWVWHGPIGNYTGSFVSNTITNHGTLTVESGLVLQESETGSASYAIDNYGATATVTVNGGKVESQNANAIRLFQGGNLNVTGGMIYADNFATIEMLESGTYIVNISGGKLGSGDLYDNHLTNTRDIILFGYHTGANQGSKITVTGGTFMRADWYNEAFYMESSTIPIEVSGGRFECFTGFYNKVSNLSISGGYFSEYIQNYVVSGKYCINNTDTTDQISADKANSYDVTASTTGLAYKVGSTAPSAPYGAEIIGTDGLVKKGYADFKAAALAVQTGETIKLLSDYSLTSMLQLGRGGSYGPSALNFTVDLNNHTLTTNQGNSTQGFWYYTSTFQGITFKNGTLNLNKKFSIYDCANSGTPTCERYLTLENVTVNEKENQALDFRSQNSHLNLNNATINYSGTGNCPIYYFKTNGTFTITSVEGSENKISATGGWSTVYSNSNIVVNGAGDLTVNGVRGLYTIPGDITLNNTGKLNITAKTGQGILCYGSVSVIGTGEVNITGKTVGIAAYDDIKTGEYGLKITNPNTTVSAESWALDVEQRNGGSGNNAAVIIEGGTYTATGNGMYALLHLDSKGKSTPSKISGGTFNGKVQLCGYFSDSIISGGTFNKSVYVETECGANKAIVTGGTFNDSVWIQDCSDINGAAYAPAVQGKNISITGGKFKDNVKTVWESTPGYVDYAGCISGGIFTLGDEDDVTDWPECIADGYVKGFNHDSITKVPYPYTVVPLEIKVNPESIAASEKKDTEGNNLSGEAVTKANTAITEMMENTAVGLFVETGIDEATKTKTVTSDSFNISMVLDAVKEAAKNASKNLASNEVVDAGAEATGEGQITIKSEDITDEMIDKKINVDLEASKIEVKTEAGTGTVTQTTVNGATFDVKPTATITITDGTTGEVISKVTAVIPNEAITSDITFRLPVDPQITTDQTAIWHSDDASNYKKDYLGIFPIMTDSDTGEKYVELSASEFSYYTYENLTSLATTNVVAILSSAGYTGFDTLADAIAAFNAGADDENPDTVDNAVAIILLDDIKAGTVYVEDGDTETEGNQPIKEPDTFDFAGKTIELDLNGHKFIADPATGTGVINATGVTVVNGDNDMEKQRLAATGVYANDVSGFILDGYDTRTNHDDATPAVGETVVENEVFNNTKADTFKIEVIASTTTDHDDENDEAELHVANRVDVFADETVKVKVVVNGAHFTAADVTLTWDTSLFADATAVWDLPAGWNVIEDASGNTIGWRFTSPKDSDSYYADGTELGEFEFTALYINESKIDDVHNLNTFTVKNDKTYSNDAKVIGSWGITLEDASTEPVPQANLYDDFAKILLMNSMTGAVEGKTNLIYKGSELEQKLLNDKYNNNKGWSAKVGGQEYAAATIEYAVLTAEEVAAHATPVYSDELPTGKDAGTYTVYYRIMADGYQTVENSVNVTIAKQKVNLEWTAPEGFAGNGSVFTGDYSADGFDAPTAKFSNLDGTDTTLLPEEIVWTSGPNDDKSLKDVGEYTFTAQDQKNYEFNNPVATVKVEGLTIEGWQLTATGSTSEDPKNGVIWRDGNEYPIGQLLVSNSTNLDPTDANVVYEYSTDNGHSWLPVPGNDPAALKYSELGSRKLKMTVTADNYEKLVQDVTFTIKNPIFKTENLEYVAGYSIVLVYTNEDAVSFRYNDTMMYDVTTFGYKYNNNNYGNGSELSAHVFATIIKGSADISKVYASNDSALQLALPSGYASNDPAYLNDVNNKTAAAVDLDDVTAVQSIYNVNSENITDIQLALRSDVTRDKRVDTIGDVSQVNAYYLSLAETN